MRRKPSVLVLFATATLALFLAASISTVCAADLTKKWRISFAGGVPPIGGFNSQDEIGSSAGNVLIVRPECFPQCPAGTDLLVDAFLDPRDPNSVFGALEIQSMSTATLAVQYGLNKNMLFEASIGYQQTDVGKVDVGVQFTGDQSEDASINPNNFLSQRIPAGKLEVMPIAFSAIAHFRPRATLDPYLGAGVGYWVVGFDIDPQLDELSRLMDASRGAQAVVPSVFTPGARVSVPTGTPELDLQGASLDVGDTFEWHLIGGAELTFKKKWSVFVDIRWVDVSRSFRIGFNGSDELGSSIPNFEDRENSVVANQTYGPIRIGGNCTPDATGNLNGEFINCTGGNSGLLDLGRLVLVKVDGEGNPVPGGDCSNPQDLQNCIIDFVFEPDGVADPGFYYVPGGTLDYDGFAMQFGIRFTFGL